MQMHHKLRKYKEIGEKIWRKQLLKGVKKDTN